MKRGKVVLERFTYVNHSRLGVIIIIREVIGGSQECGG